MGYYTMPKKKLSIFVYGMAVFGGQLERNDIFTMLSLLIHEHGMSLHFFLGPHWFLSLPLHYF